MRYIVQIICLFMLFSGCFPPAMQPQTQESTAQNSDTKLTHVWVEYRRIGGVAGLDDHLLLTETGEFSLTRRNKPFSGTVDNTQLQTLQQTLLDAHFEQLNSEYVPEKNGTDFIEYEILYANRQIRAIDTAVPDALLPVIAVLNAIIKSIK